MQVATDDLFRTLSDPTRRAIFERLTLEGELTVRVLTDASGVSQPAISKHLGLLKSAGLVRDRKQGRETHYSAEPKARAAGAKGRNWDTSAASGETLRGTRPTSTIGVTSATPTSEEARRSRAAAPTAQPSAPTLFA